MSMAGGVLKMSLLKIRHGVALLATLLATTVPALAEPPFPIVGAIWGIAGVRDGDGILIGEIEIRLQGIAAPEDRGGQVDPGGKEATEALEILALGRQVICHLDGTATSKRPVGVCSVDGRDVGRAMVRAGFARDCPAYSLGRYARDESAARADGKNLSVTYDLPGYCTPK